MLPRVSLDEMSQGVKSGGNSRLLLDSNALVGCYSSIPGIVVARFALSEIGLIPRSDNSLSDVVVLVCCSVLTAATCLPGTDITGKSYAVFSKPVSKTAADTEVDAACNSSVL